MANNVKYKILSWNVRGMNSMTKRYKILSQLNRRGVHIALLQETHITLKEGQALQKRWRGQLYYTTYSAFARGTLIWVRHGVPFLQQSSLVDPEGRYVAISGQLAGRDIALLSIYAPNIEQMMFLESLSAKLSEYLQKPILVGGDFNCVADVTLDRSHPPLRDSPTNRTARSLRMAD